MFKKLMSLLLVICILSSSVILSAAATNTTDYSKHQSAKVISKWDSKGLLSGLVANGKFKPDTPIKRAEFVYLINRTFNFTEKSNLKFSDVSAKAWYYSEISKAIAAGYIDGAGKVKFNPEAAIDKQTAILYLYKAFKLEVKNKKAAEVFNDFSKISTSCRDAVSAMVEKGYIAAKKGSSFKPAVRLTRAQALELIDKLAGTIENKTGQYKGNVNGNVIVNTKDIALKDMVIGGNLYLTEGIGSGNVRLENVKVKGQTIIRGGGENSINVINSSLIGNVLVNKKDGKVRIAAKGNTEIGNVILYSGASLQESGITGKGFVNVLLQKIGAGQTVKLNGVFGSVTLQAPKSSLQLSEGSIEKLIVDNGSPDSSITVYDNAVISSLIVFAKAKILGTGLIKSAEVVSEGVAFEKKPAELSIKDGVAVKVAGKDVDNATVSITPTPAVTPTPTSTPTPTPTTGVPYFPPSPGGGSETTPTPTSAPEPTTTPTAEPEPTATPTTEPTPTAAPTDAVNLIENGDFELNPINQNGWAAFTVPFNQPVEFLWDTYQKDGNDNHCIKISSDTSVLGICKYLAAIKPGMLYTFSIKYKLQDVVRTEENGMGVHIVTWQTDNNGQPIGSSHEHNSYDGTNDNWSELTYAITGESNTDTLHIQIGLSGTGTVWFDDVKLTEVGPVPVTPTPTPDPSATPAPTAVPTPTSIPGDPVNLVTNGNFELYPIDANGWLTFNPDVSQPAAQFTWDTYQVNGTDNHCMKISADASAFGICISHAYIKPGTTYTVSLKYKLQDVTSTLTNQMGFHVFTWQNDANNQQLGEEIYHSAQGTTQDWQELTYDFTSESNVANLSIQIGLSGTGTVWFDDVSITEKGAVTDSTPPTLPAQPPIIVPIPDSTPTPTPTPIPTPTNMPGSGTTVTFTEDPTQPSYIQPPVYINNIVISTVTEPLILKG